MGIEVLLRNGADAYTSPTEVASHADQTVPEASPATIVLISAITIYTYYYPDYC
jgi:hypothetical protein